MSRTRAAGKFRKRWACLNRDCDWFQGPGSTSRRTATARSAATRTWRSGWSSSAPARSTGTPPAASSRLPASSCAARGADEAPGAYKRLDAVLGYHAASIRILHRLTPIGVAMAGAETFDPYKD